MVDGLVIRNFLSCAHVGAVQCLSSLFLNALVENNNLGITGNRVLSTFDLCTLYAKATEPLCTHQSMTCVVNNN